MSCCANLMRRLPLRVWLLLAALAVSCGLARAAPDTPADTPDYSAAERLLFMSSNLAGLKLPATLRYDFRKSGSFEEAFDDQVGVVLDARADGRCCDGRGEFLSGPRRLPMPDLEGAQANPVVMYFLERDVREMQRLTRGSQNHFRKRIRMAIYEAATVSDVALSYRGAEVRGQEVVISPFLDDPNRPRYEKFARKEYRFMLSAAVPGGVYGIRTSIGGDGAAATSLIVEELFIEGARAPARATAP